MNESTTIGEADVANVPPEDTSTAGGEGAAYNPSVRTESNVTRLERELIEARAAEEEAAPQRTIEAAELAVQTAKDHLAWAEDSLEQAKEDVVRQADEKAAADAAKAEAEAEAAATDATAPAETEGN